LLKYTKTTNDNEICLLFAVLIEGVLFRARYLGSTQLISDGQPSKAVRMLQAQEAIGRIKVQTAHCRSFSFSCYFFQH